jgi:hypothetical protein
MSVSLFEEGGPHNIRRTGQHTYTMKVSFPKDADGQTARACPSNACLPGYFKIKNGTGITGAQESAYCPYCRRAAEPNEFLTKSQMTYAQEIMAREAHPGISRAIKDALGIGPSGKRIIGGGLLSLKLSIITAPHRRFTSRLKKPWNGLSFALNVDLTTPYSVWRCGVRTADKTSS